MIHMNQISVHLPPPKKNQERKKDLLSWTPTVSQQWKPRDRNSAGESGLDRAARWERAGRVTVVKNKQLKPSKGRLYCRRWGAGGFVGIPLYQGLTMEHACTSTSHTYDHPMRHKV